MAFAAVSTLWGMPYLFIKVAVDDGVPPWCWPGCGWRSEPPCCSAWPGGRDAGVAARRWHWIAVFGVVEICSRSRSSRPASRHVSSSLAAIIVALVLLFVALLSRIRFD